MKTEIKKEFKEELLRLGAYRRFMKNLKVRTKQRNLDIDEEINYLNKLDSFDEFVINAINWCDTPEGFYFWNTVWEGKKPKKYTYQCPFCSTQHVNYSLSKDVVRIRCSQCGNEIILNWK